MAEPDIPLEAVAPLATQVGGHRRPDDFKPEKGRSQIALLRRTSE